MKTEMINTEALLPQEWSGQLFIGEEEIEAVNRVFVGPQPVPILRSRSPKLRRPGRRYFQARLGRKHAVLVNSGTGALNVAMAAADVGPGDEVLLPATCGLPALPASSRAGGIPGSWTLMTRSTMDPNDLERKINSRTKAVLLVHMNGACGDIERIRDICRQRNLLLIEDVAQANGATFRGKPLGSFGDLSMFSFSTTRTLPAVRRPGHCRRRCLIQPGVGLSRPGLRSGRKWTAGSVRAVQSWGLGARMSELSRPCCTRRCKSWIRLSGDAGT